MTQVPNGGSAVSPAIVVLCAVLGYTLGSLPFSVWLVRWRLRRDVRASGDGNPGAVNAWKAGGWRIGIGTLFLDVAKAAVAPALGRWLWGISGWSLLPVAVLPVLGHATSPWLRFRGGKGIACTFGVWSALTLWLVPTTFGLALTVLLPFQSVAAWTVLAASTVTVAVLVALHAEPALIVAFLLNAGLLAWTHRRDLHSPPRFAWPSRRRP
ncbi:MAG: glycerol-3-phosphate acyltransferase [Candidatus Bipolaricaulis sp.]|nr:glycerol-3-phosphate acyltransferase [Candidatus Bipolaricaulis sp.]MDD5645556.1 glycerol-3-phosphate acyltransferase [Candidatus Bipolaricaulis sp.]